MTPVPCGAGLSITLLAANSTLTSCGIVVPTIGILMMLLRVLDALADRLGTSPALPRPAPTWPGRHRRRRPR